MHKNITAFQQMIQKKTYMLIPTHMQCTKSFVQHCSVVFLGGRASSEVATSEGNHFQPGWSHLVNTHYNYCLLKAIGAH